MLAVCGLRRSGSLEISPMSSGQTSDAMVATEIVFLKLKVLVLSPSDV